MIDERTAISLLQTIMIFLTAYVVGQLRLEVRRLPESVKRTFPHCDHETWKLDTQLKVMWCDSCKRGRWYRIADIEEKNISVDPNL